MDIKVLKLGAVVWDIKASEWFQIRNYETLDHVAKNWDIDFTGISITENNISLFFSDLVPNYIDETTIKYRLYKDNGLKCVGTFYGFYDRKTPHFFSKSSSSDMNVTIQFDSGGDPFKDFYHLKNNGKRTHVKYIHELQDVLDSLNEYNK